MKRLTLIAATATAFLTLFALSTTPVSAQSAGSWVDMMPGNAGAGANASGLIQIAKSKSSSKNGVDFGHGFGLGVGPNGIAISNSIGVGGGPVGAAHNMQLNIGRNGTHLSHGGVVSQGGNRRVIAGGSTGSSNGRVYGGSRVTGYGQNTRAYSKSHTRRFQPTSQPAYYGSGTSNRGSVGRVIRGGFRRFGN